MHADRSDLASSSLFFLSVPQAHPSLVATAFAQFLHPLSWLLLVSSSHWLLPVFSPGQLVLTSKLRSSLQFHRPRSKRFEHLLHDLAPVLMP